MNILSSFYCTCCVGCCTGFVWVLCRLMKRVDEGMDRLREIAVHVRKGGMAYLRQQYTGS